MICKPVNDENKKEFGHNSSFTNIIKNFCNLLPEKLPQEYKRNLKNKSNRFIKRLLDLTLKDSSIVEASKRQIYTILIENILKMGSNYLMKNSLLLLIKLFKDNNILQSSVLLDSTLIFFLCEDTFSPDADFAA